MSDTIDALNQILGIVGRREEKQDTGESLKTTKDSHLYKLLDNVAEVAGDCLEDHVKASFNPRPRKERVYREIVRQIAAYFCDPCQTVEAAQYVEEGVREILVSFDVETVDFTGRKVKIV